MLEIIEKYLRKSFGEKLSIKVGADAEIYPALLITFQNLEIIGKMHEDVFLLKLRITHIEEAENQIAFSKRSQDIYQCLKEIAQHEEQVLGVLKLNSCFKKHNETFINEFECEVLGWQNL